MNSPCDHCHFYHRLYKQNPQCDLYLGRNREDFCPQLNRYLGYQEGLAEAESKVKAREQHSLLLTEQTCEVCGEKFFGLHDCSKAYAKGFQHGKAVTLQALEAWLQGKE